MDIKKCRKCNGRIVLRAFFRHTRTGQVVRPKCARAIPIHLDGTCGQMLFPFVEP